MFMECLKFNNLIKKFGTLFLIINESKKFIEYQLFVLENNW